MTTRQVVQAFVRGTPAGSGNLSTDGTALYSYGVPVVRKTGPRTAVATATRYSVTTSKHRNAGASALDAAGYKVTEGEV